MEPDYKKVLRATSSLIKISQEIETNPSPEKSGGVLTLSLDGHFKGEIMPIGYIPQEKKDKYRNFSQEKAHRVFAHWLREPEKAISSYQTRNPKENMWGGAVLFPPHADKRRIKANEVKIISFSGLSELADEALSLAMGVYCFRYADEKFAKRVVEISNNQIYGEMFTRFKQKSL